ncbi:MAG TPA: L,D-transpeptidase [Ilumatobacter sp.]|jgi:lipoprotein-anchoring transpeptidase ErfK/SrfK|nr:L,D-transpeptidase [Ilumatobacter sp.]
MRAKLGRVAAIVMISAAAAVGSTVTLATAADASTPAPVADDVETTTTTAAPATTTAAPTTTVAPLVIDQPGVTPRRGTQLQVTPTEPPPLTTTTLPADALPGNSGSGRRVVYSKPRQRVWTVEADGTVSKTHLVSGRLTWNQPLPGTYSVFSKSMFTCNIKNPAICWRYMVRFAKGGDEGDNIGFHEIPKKNGVPVQSVSQLGTPLSGGCVRQATPDAIYMWDWAPVGTRVVVLG